VRVAGSAASVFGQLRVITDTDAPRSVVRAGEKIEEGRLRSAAGSRKRLRHARRRGIAAGGPSVVRAGKRTEGMLFWEVALPNGTRIPLRQFRDQAKPQPAQSKR
jgi:hypothetical protein